MVTRASGAGGTKGTSAIQGAASTAAGTAAPSTKDRGDAAESRALAWLQARGLVLEQRNYRVARGPSARGGEIDLVMRDSDGTLVFVEVRQRSRGDQGGAAASVTHVKRRRLVHAAQHYLLRYERQLPPCRFDVVAIDGDDVEWLQGAFDAG